jgi:hypothetical protein
MEGIKSNATAELWRITKEIFRLCFYKGSIDEASVCACNGLTLKVAKRYRMSYQYSIIPQFRELTSHRTLKKIVSVILNKMGINKMHGCTIRNPQRDVIVNIFLYPLINIKG